MRRSIPFPATTSPGAKPQEAGGRIVNGYIEKLGDQAPGVSKPKTVIRRGPGLDNFGTSDKSGYRGAILVQNVLYAGFNGKLEKWTSAGGTSTNVGNLTGTKRGFFASNNAATPDKVFCDPDGNVATFTPSSVTNSFDSDLPSSNSVTAFGGYFIFTTGAGAIWATDLNAVTVSSTSNTVDQTSGGLQRGIAWGGRFIAFGNKASSVYQDVGSTPFPLAKIATIPRGIAGPYCVSGHEEGLGRGPIWVGDDSVVYKLDGYTPVPVSPPDLNGLIEAVSDKTTLVATSYISRGHPFWQLSCPAWTWVLDVSTSQWAQRDSYGATRSRISGAINAFSKWLTGDESSGNIQQITSTANDEIDNPLRLRIESGPVANFPAGEVVGRADFHFTTGVGEAGGHDPDATDPDVEISWSDDGGITWSNPVLRKLGRQQEATQLVSLVACTGRSSWLGRRWRLDISAAVYASFMFATQSTDPRVA